MVFSDFESANELPKTIAVHKALIKENIHPILCLEDKSAVNIPTRKNKKIAKERTKKTLLISFLINVLIMSIIYLLYGISVYSIQGNS